MGCTVGGLSGGTVGIGAGCAVGGLCDCGARPGKIFAGGHGCLASGPLANSSKASFALISMSSSFTIALSTIETASACILMLLFS